MNKGFMVLTICVLALGLAVGNSAAWGKDMKNTAVEFRASKIIGMEVKDQQREKVGVITDLLVDPQEPGRIIFAVLDPARSLKFGHDRLIAVPFGALSRDDTKGIYVLNMTRDKLVKAPSFEEHHWPNLTDRSWSSEVYQYYGEVPYWSEGQTDK